MKSRKLPSGVENQRRVPEFPYPDRVLESTLGYWEAVWLSPMGQVFLPADFDALVRLALLRDEVHKGDRSCLGEIRALEDRFGLSPLARRRLQWEIDAAEGALASLSTPAVEERPDDDERFLRAVK